MVILLICITYWLITLTTAVDDCYSSSSALCMTGSLILTFTSYCILLFYTSCNHLWLVGYSYAVPSRVACHLALSLYMLITAMCSFWACQIAAVHMLGIDICIYHKSGKECMWIKFPWINGATPTTRKAMYLHNHKGNGRSDHLNYVLATPTEYIGLIKRCCTCK